MKSRTLYQVRNYRAGTIFGTAVGHKCRLIPRSAAIRIRNRLKKMGLDVMISPMKVNVSKEQDLYLARRYQ
jgi:hypothetical protein